LQPGGGILLFRGLWDGVARGQARASVRAHAAAGVPVDARRQDAGAAMRARGIFLIVALAAQLHAVGAVKREKAVPVPAPARAPAEPKVPAPKRIILVTIDTWRWDA